jgi:protein-L-isoaspartate(D-aspartate) O-methyltransferase
MGAQVFTIERQKALFDFVKNIPVKSKYHGIKFFYGDGFEGLPTYAPFDKVLITAAAPFIPEKLIQQLKVGGKMVNSCRRRGRFNECSVSLKFPPDKTSEEGV